MMDQSASPSSSGSYKRARLPTGGNEMQVASCLVDGCNSDLTKGRDYHRRHKVCELHSKTPRVTIRGLEQRFCQQCSRFHSLEEFDEGKRSCRKRLDGHNRRRRKPQAADSLSLNPANAHQGAKILNFDTRQMYQPRATMSSTWSVSARGHSDSMLYNSHTQSNLFDRRNSFDESLLHGCREGKPNLLSLQSTDSGLHQALQNPGPGGGSGCNKMFSDGIDRAIGSSNHAPSLLSSSSQSATRGFFPGQMVQLGLSSLTQSSIPRAQFNGSGPENRPFGDNFPPHGASGNSNVHCQELFQINPDGSSSASGTEKTISFSWQ